MDLARDIWKLLTRPYPNGIWLRKFPSRRALWSFGSFRLAICKRYDLNVHSSGSCTTCICPFASTFILYPFASKRFFTSKYAYLPSQHLLRCEIPSHDHSHLPVFFDFKIALRLLVRRRRGGGILVVRGGGVRRWSRRPPMIIIIITLFLILASRKCAIAPARLIIIVAPKLTKLIRIRMRSLSEKRDLRRRSFLLLSGSGWSPSTPTHAW